MPRGRRTSYTRDNRGRFASSPGGGAPKRSTPATGRVAMRAGNRLNRDNEGRITGIGRNGATVRGGRLRTAGGNKRATQIASMRPAGFRSGTIAKGGRGVSGPVARSLAAVRRGVKAAKAPAIQATGRTRAQAAAAQRSRNKRLADYAELSISLNPRVSRNSRVTEEGRYAESFGRPVIARRKYLQPNIFGGIDRVAGSNRARLVGTRERGQVGVIPLAARALPIKGRGKKKPRPYGSR